jgi:hypothetical protein
MATREGGREKGGNSEGAVLDMIQCLSLGDIKCSQCCFGLIDNDAQAISGILHGISFFS